MAGPTISTESEARERPLSGMGLKYAAVLVALLQLGAARPASAEGLYLICAGEGSPIVVLEAGASRTSSDWAQVMKKTAPLTRVCAYDRAGTGKSPPGPASMSALDHARALAALLDTIPV